MKEASRVLKPRGILVVNVPSDTLYAFLPKVLGQKIVKLLFYTFNMYCVFNPKKLFRDLLNLGFKVEDYRYTPSFLSMFVFEIIALLMMFEKLYGVKASKLITLLSLFFPITSFIEKLLGLSKGSEYVVKARRGA